MNDNFDFLRNITDIVEYVEINRWARVDELLNDGFLEKMQTETATFFEKR